MNIGSRESIEHMAWAWIRPVDRGLLAVRPLVDVGCGDGQTLAALTEPDGLRVGIDASPETLPLAHRTGVVVVRAGAAPLPFRGSSVGAFLAADLFHHLDDEALSAALAEMRRCLRPGGRLVAWWYERPGRRAPDAPKHPRALAAVAGTARDAGFGHVGPLDLEVVLEPAPATVGIIATA